MPPPKDARKSATAPEFENRQFEPAHAAFMPSRKWIGPGPVRCARPQRTSQCSFALAAATSDGWLREYDLELHRAVIIDREHAAGPRRRDRVVGEVYRGRSDDDDLVV